MDLRDDQPDRHEFGRRVYLVAHVDPLDLDGVRTVAVGAGLWLLAFLGLLPFWSPLQDSGRLWWVWTCMAGVSLGLFGLEYCRRRRTAREARHDLEADHEAVPLAHEPTVVPPHVDAAPEARSPRPATAATPARSARSARPARPARPAKGGRRKA